MRTQALSFFAFKLRSQQELDALLGDVSARGGRKLVDSYYREATKKPYSFLHRRLCQSEPQFLERFDFVLEPSGILKTISERSCSVVGMLQPDTVAPKLMKPAVLPCTR